MATYFFDQHTSCEIDVHPEGTDLLDLSTARRMALSRGQRKRQEQQLYGSLPNTT
jgi:hypothetical protein